MVAQLRSAHVAALVVLRSWPVGTAACAATLLRHVGLLVSSVRRRQRRRNDNVLLVLGVVQMVVVQVVMVVVRPGVHL